MLLDIARDCQRNGIPDMFFAQRRVNSGGLSLISDDALDAKRKPLWVDTKNPFSLYLLQQLAEENEWISLRELIPGPDQLCAELNGQGHVSEVQIEMMIHAGWTSSDTGLSGLPQ
jgi:hypothetical protein